MNKRIIKKYANRRLYDTADSRYVTLGDLRRLVTEGQPFEVIDAKDGSNLTRSMLLQIIVEQEEEGPPTLSNKVMEQLIRHYGNNLQTFVSTYLDRSMEFFNSQQEVLQNQFEKMLSAAPPSVWKDMTERNLALWSDFQRDLLRGFTRSGKTDDDSN